MTIDQLNAMSDVGDLRTLYKAPEQKQPEKKPQGNNLLSLLPSAAAAAASFIPGVGTLAGGLIGGAGEAGRQLLSGEDFDLGKVGREAALSAVPFALGKAGKIVGGVKDAIKAGEGVAGATKAAGAAIAPITTARKTAVTTGEPTSSLLDKFKINAQRTSQEGFGLKVGQNEGRGKVLTPDQATDKFNFITEGSKKYGGIRAGKPADQAADAQNVFNNVTKSLDDTLTKINRPLDPTELVTIGQGITERIGKNALITGKSSPTAQKLIQELQGATDLKALEAIRRKADDIAFTQSGAGRTSSAAQAKDVRDAIDEFITPLSAEYKAVKGDYSKAKDTLTTLSKANASSKGVKIPFIEAEVGKQAIPGAINKGAEVAGSTRGSSMFDKIKRGGKFGVEIGKQGLTRMVASPIAYPTETPTEEIPDPSNPSGLAPTPTTPQRSKGGITQEQLMAAVAADPKNASTYMSMYKLFNEASESKPLSAEASRVIANANSGLTSLGQLRSTIQEAGVPTGTLLPGRDLFGGAGARLLGTGAYDNAAKNVADVITRLRTGAALTEAEEKFYLSQLPQALDDEKTIEQKLNMFGDLFNSIANRTGSAGSDLAQSLQQ